MNTAITIQGVSKRYKRSEQSTYLALRDVITNAFSNKKKEDDESFFWALNDINLEIEKGERVGIIGRNGAGKSTLLKIISRITPPTRGKIILNGRVASLLEVGTGFHPELTGRENIYLNGSILGLNKKEITAKLDEIIDFSGVEKFIDSPLKHYSSGMQLRLAFSVAAHLEPEILLIDEVLAVGDMEFQQKCIGKMEEISKQSNRTIIFVSHNMAAINNFCDIVVLLSSGKIRLIGKSKAVIDHYSSKIKEDSSSIYIAPVLLSDSIQFTKVFLSDIKGDIKNIFALDEIIVVNFELQKDDWSQDFTIGFGINDLYNKRLIRNEKHFISRQKEKKIQGKIIIDAGIFTPNTYTIDVSILKNNVEIFDLLSKVLSFEISKVNTEYENIIYDYGVLNKQCSWIIEPI